MDPSARLPHPIVLASQSPRRRELLMQIGVSFIALPARIEERRHRGEPPSAFVQRMAREKAEVVHREGIASFGGHRLPTLGADTVVVIDDGILGKPRSRREAIELISRLSGRQHQVMTAVALAADQTQVRLSVSQVWFRDISPAERDAYCATDEPMDKAGAYAIQGLGSVFVERLDGSYSGVMGLPLFETAGLLKGAGIPVL